jgi:chitin synthase
VSWGTKGDNTTQTDLGVVGNAKDNKVDVAVPEDEKDINAAYEDALAVINRCLSSVFNSPPYPYARHP